MNNSDLNNIIGGWKYDPTAINARWVMGADGRPKVQLRLDLGVLQMELSGRPDGQHLKGFDSLLDYYLFEEENMKKNGKALQLSVAECAELQQEAAQYYYRYISLYSLRDFDRVIADTEHNIAIINLVGRCAENQEAAWQLVQFYTYVRMMDARARAERAIDRKAYDQAVEALKTGIVEIRQFLNDYSQEGAKESREIDLLQELLGEINHVQPKSETDQLRDEMQAAIQCENYERAAIIRDKLTRVDLHPHSTFHGC